MKKILKKIAERSVINGKQKKIRKEDLSIHSVSDTIGNSIGTVLSIGFLRLY